MKEPNRILVIKECEECPARVDQESHGPCDSDYWVICNKTKKTIDGEDYRKTWKKFPPSCPLKEVQE